MGPVSEWMVGNPETDRLPVAGSISEWPVSRTQTPGDKTNHDLRSRWQNGKVGLERTRE